MRSDKKFLVKIWVQHHNKKIFRLNCLSKHISMMYAGEKMIMFTLNSMTDNDIDLLIDRKKDLYNVLNKSANIYEIVGVRLLNDPWQKLGYFAIQHDISIAKVGSIIFDHAQDIGKFRELDPEFIS